MARPSGRSAFSSISILVLPVVLAALPSLAQQAPGTPSSQVDGALRTGNFDRAAALLEERAQTGDVEAQYQLASLYRSGRGVGQDDVAAFRWMKAAAEKGHVRAQFNLAKMYLAGRGVPMDARQGRAWLTRAAAHGHSEASKLLSEIAGQGGTPNALHDWATKVEIDGSQAPSSGPTLSAKGLADRNGHPAIVDAAWRGQSQAVRQLVASGANVAITDEDGNTPLALAAAGGHRETIEILLGAGASASVSNRAGETPLMQAAAKGHAAVVALLLGRG